ncbi:unnamed protein product, partial [Didymodactylos carnosus]
MFAVLSGLVGYYYVYGAAEPEHRCRLPSSVWPNDQYKIMSLSHEKLIDLWIPKDDKYHIYTSDREKIVCGLDGWVYDRSVYGFTFTEEAQLISKSRAKRSTIATVMQSGGISALFIGSLSDKFGRKTAARWVILLIFVISLLTQIAMQWIPMSVNAKFDVLLFNHFTAGLSASSFAVIFVLLLELTSSSHTSLAGNSALEFIRAQSLRAVTQNELSFIQKVKRLLSRRVTIQKLLIIGAIGFTNLLLYIKISYGLGAMHGISSYVGILIGATVEAVGYISGSVLLITRLGRKYAFIVFTTLTLLCVLIIPFLIEQHSLPTVIIAQLGKYAISGSICVSWIYVSELFSTSIRSSANGFFSAISRVGAIIAPVIDSSVGEKYIRIT